MAVKKTTAKKVASKEVTPAPSVPTAQVTEQPQVEVACTYCDGGLVGQDLCPSCKGTLVVKDARFKK